MSVPMTTQAPHPSPSDNRPPRLRNVLVNLLGLGSAGGVIALLGNAISVGRTAQAVAVVGISSFLTAIAVAPGFGILLWLVAAPFGRLFTISMGHGVPNLGLNRLAAVFVCLLLLVQTYTGKRRLSRLSRGDAAAALFVLGMLIAVADSHLGRVSGLQNVFDFALLPVLMYYFGRNLLGRQPWLHRIPVALAIIGLALGAIVAREQLTGQPILSSSLGARVYSQYSVQVTSLFDAPAIMSLTLSLTVPALFVGVARSRAAAARLLWGGALVMAVIGTLLAYVRAGWLAAVIGLLVVIVFSRSARRFTLLALPIAAVLVLLLWNSIIAPRAILQRLQSEGPVTYRLEALQTSLAIARSAPIFGVGLDNYADAAVQAGWLPRSKSGLVAAAPHNLYMYVLTSAGLVGLLPFLAFLGLAAWRALSLWRLGRTRPDVDQDTPTIALAMLAGYATFALTFDSLHAQVANMLLFTVIGAVFGEHDHIMGRRAL